MYNEVMKRILFMFTYKTKIFWLILFFTKFPIANFSSYPTCPVNPRGWSLLLV